ncbi:uncharacterized protein LOC129739648 [Uranotaenia lowii]|uniref:uncharacterized protein LOC129739648 n=1 Tax=Uranotaenia lowii TaxID=190385 RepID=UPI0024797B5F|nr:uncharacterized protein LOC129739648 [Uranotaenia lowii]
MAKFVLLGILCWALTVVSVLGVIGEKSRKICENKYSVACLKMEIVSFLERVSDQNEVDLTSGISVVRDSDVNVTKTAEIISEVSRIFPTDPNKRLDEFLVMKLNDYLRTHSLRLKLLDGEAMERANAVFEGRKKLKKGGMATMLAAAMMMKGTLAAVALGAVAAIAGKALMTGLLALTLAAIMGLKSLAGGGGGGHKSTTYEIVAKPMYSHSHSEGQEDLGHSYGSVGGGGWGRSQKVSDNGPEYFVRQKYHRR